MQSTRVQREMQPESESRDLALSTIAVTCDITVKEQQISKLGTEYKQKRQR